MSQHFDLSPDPKYVVSNLALIHLKTLDVSKKIVFVFANPFEVILGIEVRSEDSDAGELVRFWQSVRQKCNVDHDHPLFSHYSYFSQCLSYFELGHRPPLASWVQLFDSDSICVVQEEEPAAAVWTQKMLRDCGTFLFVLGVALVVYSFHLERVMELASRHKVVYRYVERDQVDGAFSDADLGQFQDMFDDGIPPRSIDQKEAARRDLVWSR
jgi:hypothetical protein